MFFFAFHHQQRTMEIAKEVCGEKLMEMKGSCTEKMMQTASFKKLSDRLVGTGLNIDVSLLVL